MTENDVKQRLKLLEAELRQLIIQVADTQLMAGNSHAKAQFLRRVISYCGNELADNQGDQI
jgi:hypothetical protein